MSDVYTGQVDAYSSVSMLVHAMASMPAKNAGALVAVKAIEDAVPLLHGPLGCAALRKINSFGVYSLFSHAPCTNMGEIDVVYGGEKRLKRGIIETYERYRPSLIVVIPTCPSDMIGDDLEAVVRKAKKEVDCEVVYSTGDLIKGRPIGYHDVLYSVFDQLLTKELNVTPKNSAVNIITFPIHTAGNKLEETKSMLEEMGIEVNKVFFHHTRLADLYDFPRAPLNITDLSMPWLDRMVERFGVKYYATASLEHLSDPEEFDPHGIEKSAQVFMEIGEMLGKGEKAREVVYKRKKEVQERLKEATKTLKGVKVAITGGFYFGMGLLLVKEMGMRAEVLIYKTYGLESHGMSKEAIRKIIKSDQEVAQKYGPVPRVLINPSHEDEIRVIRETGSELVVAPGADLPRYHAAGIKAFDSLKFYFYNMRLGFNCFLELAQMLRNCLEKPLQKNPLLGWLEYDRYEASLLPSWVKLENVWRAVTEGADGGCLYG